MDIFLIFVTHPDLVNRCGWSEFHALIFVLYLGFEQYVENELWNWDPGLNASKF